MQKNAYFKKGFPRIPLKKLGWFGLPFGVKLISDYKYN